MYPPICLLNEGHSQVQLGIDHIDPLDRRRRTSLLCVRSEAVSASRASALLRAGIVWLRRSAAPLAAS